ncbi:hypothetical protein L3i20_v248420 [Paenibacillus sp. L3-i20]|nr:hypothetical protein L3i20_v248420 [Paenibacillus sp. L3-i20]
MESQIPLEFGKPASENTSNMGEGEECFLTYEAGDYNLYFTYENEKAEKGHLCFKLK